MCAAWCFSPCLLCAFACICAELCLGSSCRYLHQYTCRACVRLGASHLACISAYSLCFNRAAWAATRTSIRAVHVCGLVLLTGSVHLRNALFGQLVPLLALVYMPCMCAAWCCSLVCWCICAVLCLGSLCPSCISIRAVHLCSVVSRPCLHLCICVMLCISIHAVHVCGVVLLTLSAFVHLAMLCLGSLCPFLH